MGGLGRKRTAEERRKAKEAKKPRVKLRDDNPDVTAAGAKVLAILEQGSASTEEIGITTGIGPRALGGIVSQLVVKRMIERTSDRRRYRLGPASPQMRSMPDGQAQTGGLLDTLPMFGRANLGQLSCRDFIQAFRVLTAEAMVTLRKIDPLDQDSYRRAQISLNEASDQCRKWYRTEADVNPGLAVDAVEITVVGISTGPLDKDFNPVDPEEAERRIAVVRGLMGDAIQQARKAEGETA